MPRDGRPFRPLNCRGFMCLWRISNEPSLGNDARDRIGDESRLLWQLRLARHVSLLPVGCRGWRYPRWHRVCHSSAAQQFSWLVKVWEKGTTVPEAEESLDNCSSFVA